MIFKNSFTKKGLGIFLSVSLLCTLSVGVQTGLGQAAAKQQDVPAADRTGTHPLPSAQVAEMGATELTTQKNGIFEGVRTSVDTKDAFAQDVYRITQEDMEGLLRQGHTLEDIYLADELGNQLIENPKNLLEMKKKTGETFEAVAVTVKEQHLNMALQSLQAKHPLEAERLRKENLKDQEQVELLKALDHQPNQDVDILIKKFREKGAASLQDVFQRKGGKGVASIEKLKQLGLTAEQSQGFSDQELDRYKKLAEKTNQPLSNLLKKIKAKEAE